MAKLVERGKLSWTTTIGNLVGTPRAGKYADVTIQQILGHRAGFAANVSVEMMQKSGTSTDSLPVQRHAALDYALASEPVSTPGTAHLYSNMGYIAMGAMLEQQAGVPWEQLVRDEILTPLRLTTAGFGAPGTSSDLSQPRGHRLAGSTLVAVEPGPGGDNPAFLGPAGTLHMSIVDLARWGQENLRGERGVDGLVRAATYRVLHAPLEGQNYALGWNNPPPARTNGARVIAHLGSNTIWSAAIAFDPNTDRGIIIVSNVGTESQRAAVMGTAIDRLVGR